MSGVIRQAFRVHPHTEVIVVANGSTDGTKETAARLGAKVVSFPFPLGHDVGRSVGAREARGSVLLFLDGDFVIRAELLRPLVRAVQAGVDVALNSYLGPTGTRSVHRVVLAKHALNTMMSRMDLKGASMTTIPHALSRRALAAIGAEHLAVPPLAQAIALAKGLNVRAKQYIHVGGSVNRKRNRVSRHRDPIGELIVGDHLEAIHWVIAASNERAGLPDLARNRNEAR
jgi:glycosyltransferase involved in cell wall biosynthesis